MCLTNAGCGESFVRNLEGQGTVVAIDLFTRREAEIVARIVEGRANKEIAAELRCSAKTVEFHIRNMFRKTSVSSRLELPVARSHSSVRRQAPRSQAGLCFRSASLRVDKGNSRCLVALAALGDRWGPWKSCRSWE